MSNIPEPLRAILFDYCHVDWADEVNELPLDVNRDDWAYDVSLFKSQLRDSIKQLAFSVEEFVGVTGESLDTQEELIERLKSIWGIAFPDEAP